jgi:hypothetical protein
MDLLLTMFFSLSPEEFCLKPVDMEALKLGKLAIPSEEIIPLVCGDVGQSINNPDCVHERSLLCTLLSLLAYCTSI